MNPVMVKPPRAILHAARLADAVLFWPVLAYVLWGQLQPDVPRCRSRGSTISSCISRLISSSARWRAAPSGSAGAVKWAVLGLIVVGAAIEIIQAYVGRETSVLDGVANGAGAIAGALLARFVLDPLRRRWGYDTDTPST